MTEFPNMVLFIVLVVNSFGVHETCPLLSEKNLYLLVIELKSAIIGIATRLTKKGIFSQFRTAKIFRVSNNNT